MEKLRNTINTILGWACVFVFAVMVVVGTYQIVVRYFFNNPSTVLIIQVQYPKNY